MAGTRQEPYIRKREDPHFKGVRRGDAALTDRSLSFGYRGNVTSQKFSKATSDVGDSGPKVILSDTSEISERAIDKSLEDLISDSNVEPYGQSLSGRGSKLTKKTTFAFPIVKSDTSVNLDEGKDMLETSLTAYDTNEDSYTFSDMARPTIERSYSVNKMRSSLSKIPLPQSAALFFIGFSPQIEVVESCESINRLNSYLKASRDEVNAGVPGRFLHAVMGQDLSDIGSVASTIMYAFYLHETWKIKQFCIVPVINMKRADLSSHAELKWLLDSCQIDQSSLIFLDEIDLSYYDLFGSLKIVLLNGDRLPTKQEVFKDAVVEIFGCKKVDSVYPWVETVTAGQDCSCCTLIAEKFALSSPEILAGQGFSRLLLASILLDTGNLTYPRCTSKDKYIATLLINGAGRFGCNGLYQILRYKMYDVSDLKVEDILRKDFKKWIRGKPESASSRGTSSYIGMSSIGISVAQLLAHKDTSTQEIIYFQQLEKVRLLMIVSGYYDMQKNFKREVLVSAESVELMTNLLNFFNSNASQLPLKVLRQPGLRDDMRAFEIDKVTSRKTIERLLDEFFGASKR